MAARSLRASRPAWVRRALLPGLSGAAVLLLVLAPPFPLTARAPELSQTLTFSPGDLLIRHEGAHDRIELAGWSPDAAPGEPLLPVLALRIALPRGTVVSRVVVDEAERSNLPGSYRPFPALSAGDGSAAAAGRRVEGPAYAGAGEFPPEILELTGHGCEGDERVAHLAFHGVRWDPASGALALYTRVSFHLELEAAGAEAPAPLPRLCRDRMAPAGLAPGRSLADAAGEPETGEFILLHPGQYPVLDGSVVEYVIVTRDSLASEFQRLADWRTRLGTPAAVRTIEEIEAGYPQGVDLQDKIRLFLRDAYTYWGARWVLLGGDNPLLPSRRVFLDYFFLNGAFVASDVYYSSLDGNWDHDGDGIFGEAYVDGWNQGDWVDLYPEVYVGRAPVETRAEASVFVDKVLAYQRQADPSYVKTALFCAEVVFPVDWTPGMPIDLNGCDVAHDAGAFLPAAWDTLYLCEWPNQNENLDAVVDALNEGYHLVGVVGHGDAFKWSTGDGRFFMIDHALALTNTDRLSVFFYANCNTNQSDTECLNEYLLLHPTGGAVASVATTHYDFPDVGRHYEDEFYRLYAGTDVLTVGELAADMKIPFIPLSQRESAHRWTQMAYNLLGDPALPLWRTGPTVMRITDAGSLAVGDTSYTVTVKKSGGIAPVVGARVTLWKADTGEYARATTDGAGVAVLPFRPASPGMAYLGVFHPSFYPGLDSVAVVAGAPIVRFQGITVDDDSLGASLGNANGVVEAGERVELGLTLTNDGPVATDSLTGTLSLLAGSRLAVDVRVDGLQEPGLLLLGQHRMHPPALPCTLGFGSPLPTLGRPPYSAEAPGDTAADPQDSSAVDVPARIYLWEDGSGWHLRAAGALEPHTFGGSLWGDGALRALQPAHLEPGDVLGHAQDSVFFAFAVDPTEAEDGLDLVVADSLFVRVVAESASYGVIGPGESVTRSFVVDALAGTPDGRRVRLDLHTAGTGTARDDAVALEVRAPRLEQVTHVIADTVSGDGDRIPEPGEVVCLWPTVLNGGGGAAVGVTGLLGAISGAAVSESLAAFADLPPGAQGQSLTPLCLTMVDSVAHLSLTLATSRGDSRVDTFNIGIGARPPAPTGPRSLPGDVWLDLRWNPVSHPDLRGYNLYAGSGSGPTLNERLIEGSARYHLEGLVPETTYLIRVVAVDSSGNQSPLSATLVAKTGSPYQAGWPVSARNRVWSSPVVANLELDGTREVIVGSRDWRVCSWQADGSSTPGWPKVVGDQADASPAAGDVDGDDRMEVFAGADDGNVYAWRADGSGYIDPDGLFSRVGSRVRSSPTIADLDQDGVPEILVGDDGGTLHAWRNDGTGYLQPDGVFATVSGSIYSSPSVADVDGDSLPEIIVTSYLGGVYAWNHDGTPLRLEGGLFRWIGNGRLFTSPALGDVDADGSVEIVVTGCNDSAYVFRSTSAPLTGWPKYVGAGGWSSPALGDLDNDGKLEIVAGFHNAKIHAWRYSGTAFSGWPATLPDTVATPVVIGDITGDGVPEVVVGCTDGRIYALKTNGAVLGGWPRSTHDAIYSSPALGDLDGDGDVEVVCASFDGFVYAFDLSAPYNPNDMDWPMFKHDRHHSGFAGWRDPIPTGVAGGSSGSGAPRVTELALPAPNPARGGARLGYQLRSAGPVTLALYDVTGRRVQVLAEGSRDAGRHEVVWDGRDGRGHAVEPGVYFLRLATPERTVVRKMVVAR